MNINENNISTKKPSFINKYFEGKSGDKLRSTITPNWKSTNAHLKMIGIHRNIQSVLEVGCGIGRLLKELNKDIPNCVGFDASKDMISEGHDYCEGKVQLLKCDGYGELPIHDVEFDCCFSIITFQHIPNTDTVKKYISEMYRLLKPGGIIKFQLLTYDEKPDHFLWTWHNPIDLMDYMRTIGFNSVTKRTVMGDRWTVLEGKK